MVAALDRAMGESRPATEPTRPIAPVPPVTPQRAGGNAWPWVMAGVAALVVLAVAGAVLLSGGDKEPQSAQPTATATAERTPEKTRTPEPTPTATKTPEPEPTQTAEPQRTGGTDLDRAADLQLQGYNARVAGDYDQALALSTQALEACGDTQQLSPCGYALYEVGAALNALGRPDEAIPYLQQRLDRYGPNKEVEKELKAAEKAAKKG
jgi:serine/threonine-protein kinase